MPWLRREVLAGILRKPAQVLRFLFEGWKKMTPHYSTGTLVLGAVPEQDTATGVLTLPDVPLRGPALFVNGIRQKPFEDYTQAGAVLTPVAGNVDLYKDPQAVLVVDYVK
jgi:hypothetical protein